MRARVTASCSCARRASHGFHVRTGLFDGGPDAATTRLLARRPAHHCRWVASRWTRSGPRRSCYRRCYTSQGAVLPRIDDRGSERGRCRGCRRIPLGWRRRVAERHARRAPWEWRRDVQARRAYTRQARQFAASVVAVISTPTARWISSSETARPAAGSAVNVLLATGTEPSSRRWAMGRAVRCFDRHRRPER